MRHHAAKSLHRAQVFLALTWAFVVSAVGAESSSTATPVEAPQLSSGGLVDRTNPIQRLVLDPNRVTRVFVGEDRLTTLRFPSPVAGLESARVVTEAHPEALFQVFFQPGEAFFSVRALAAKASTTLNVVWRHQTYVFELIESPVPWLSVVLEMPRPVASLSRRAPLGPSQLLGRLDTAKAYSLLRQQHPNAVAEIEVVRPNTTRDYGDYTIRTEEVFRFDADDVLVFRIVLRNTMSNPIHFVPASLMVRVGTRLYPQSITDAAGVLPSQTDVPVYFAVAGAADGSRTHLSPENDFFVLLNRLPSESRPAPEPTRVPAATPTPATTATPVHVSPLPTVKVPTNAMSVVPRNPYGVQAPSVTAPRHPVSPSRRRESWPPRIKP
ncbi:MAG: hypothetical protein AB7O66_10875 [Limisphaerales bacterium]